MAKRSIRKYGLKGRKLVSPRGPTALFAFTKADLARALRQSKPRPDPLGKPMDKEAHARPRVVP